MFARKSIDLLLIAFDRSDELLQQTCPCYDCSSTGSKNCRIRRRLRGVPDLVQTPGDQFGIAAVVINKEPLDRGRPGPL